MRLPGSPPGSRRRRRLATGLAAAVGLGVATLAVPAAPASAAVTCSVAYSVTGQWEGGFQGSVTITNSGDALTSWTLGWTYANGQRVTQLWNGKVTQNGAAVSVANESYNGSVASGGTVNFGFLGSWSGTNTAPSAFTLNGTACTGPNKPPAVTLTSPTPGTEVPLGGSVNLAATASDPDGSIAKVEFYEDTRLVGTDTSAPYEASWTPSASGSYSVTAKAFDDRGASTSSSPAGLTVLSGPSITVSPSAVQVVKGASTTYTVKLSTAPSGNVTVTSARTAGTTGVSVTGGGSLTFTPSNWSTAQTVTLTSASGGSTGTATVTSSAPGHASAAVAVTELAAGTSEYDQRFLDMYNEIHDPANGYFSPQGVPYHSIETLIVEAPDHGHQTTSEAFSYYQWIEATYGRITGDWAPYNTSWDVTEDYIIPSAADQPTNSFYDPNKPATYAKESPDQADYPVQLEPGVSVGKDPLANELKSAYGTSDIYGMHWLLDVDNTYGFGRCGDGTTKPAYMNSYQRGSSESVWETIPQPSCDVFAHGGPNGYLDLFVKDASYAKQWKYTNAPDADARAVQVAYWALQWATAQGKQSEISGSLDKAAKMGDYLRYAMFDKYFKKIGNCVGASACAAGTGKDSAHYLMSWYYAWGGAKDANAGWAWRIGDGASHQGYQNPLAAYALSQVDRLKPKGTTAVADWSTSLTRQLELYRWLQSSDGAIAGGVTNTWEGQYGTPPAGTPTFYGMFYDAHPVWRDPPSNRWFGFQVWSLERVAAYYYATGDAKAKAVLDKWVPWALSHTTVNADGTWQHPSDLTWTGQPDTWNAASPGANSGLRVSVANYASDVGVAGALAKTLTYYAAKSGNTAARDKAKALLDAIWSSNRDAQGVSVVEERGDYNRFDDPVYVPGTWSGTTPTGDAINSSSTFVSIRSWYRQDPQWSKVQTYLDGGPAPTFRYHRFWAQADVATAFAVYGELFD